jgi:chemotaxis protein CheX
MRQAFPCRTGDDILFVGCRTYSEFGGAHSAGKEKAKLKAEFVNPFVESIYELFGTMLSAKIVRTGLAITEGNQMPHEVMALIGFSGVMRGTVALALPAETCRYMVSRLLGNSEDSDDETVSDTIAEMVNIIAGSAKAKLSQKVKQTLELSLPVVFRGQEFAVYSPSKAMWVEVPFESDLGPLRLRLSFKLKAGFTQ